MYSLIAFDGQVYGPVDLKTLIQWCQQGRIVAGTHLVETATGRSFVASDMMELRPFLPDPMAISQQPYQPQVQQQPYQPSPGPFGSVQQTPYQPQGGFQQPYVPPQANQAPYNIYSPPGQQYYGMGGLPKSRATALWLCFLLGPLGIHRYYLGLNRSATYMLLAGILSLILWPLIIVVLVWQAVDMMQLWSGQMRDSQGVAPR